MRKPDPWRWMLPRMALALAAGILIGRAASEPLYGALALLAAIPACFLTHGLMRRLSALAAAMALGFVCGYAAYHPSLPAEGDYLISGVVSEEIRIQDNGQVRTSLSSLTLDGQSLRSGGYWTFYLRENETLPDNLIPGAQVSFRAQLYHPGGQENPGGFNFQEYLLQRGITVGVYGKEELAISGDVFSLATMGARLRHLIARKFIAAMGEEAGGYAATVILGARHLIPEDDRDAFIRLGIAHILSVSGYHTGVLAWVFTWILRKLRVSLRTRSLLIAIVLAFYCLLTGGNPPVIRASLLIMLSMLGRLRHKQNLDIHLLSASAILTLLLSPAQLTSASFQLTYGAMLGLALVTPMLNLNFLPRRPTAYHPFLRSLFYNIGAHAGILFPILYWYHEFPLLSLPMNLLLTGGATFVLGLDWIVLLLLPFAPLARFVGGFVARLTQLILAAIRLLGQSDAMMLWTRQAGLITLAGWILLLYGFSLFCTRRLRWPGILGALLIVVSLFPVPNFQTSYIQLSVGAADAALLHDKNAVIAIDAGEDATLAEYLHQRRLSLDALLLTHLHSDHAGGMEALLENNIPIQTVYLPFGAENAEVDPGMTALLDRLLAKGTTLAYLSRGNQLPLPSGSLRVLWPEEGKVRPHQDANSYSAVLLAEISGVSMLLTGDLDGVYEHYAAVPADILKLAHHGSASSTSPEFLEKVAPQTLLLSCGDVEREAEVLRRTNGLPVFATCSHGAVTIEFSDHDYTVRTLR